MPDRMVRGIRCFQSAVNFLMEANCDFYRDFPKPWKFATVSNDLLFTFMFDFVLHASIGTCLYTYLY